MWALSVACYIKYPSTISTILFLSKDNITRNQIILLHIAIFKMYKTIINHLPINILQRLDCNMVDLGNNEIIMKHGHVMPDIIVRLIFKNSPVTVDIAIE